MFFGENSAGEAAFVADKSAADLETVALMFGAHFVEVMGADQTISLPALRAERPPASPFLPAAGGFRFMVMTIPAGCSPLRPGADTDAELALLREVDPVMADELAKDPDGMAKADTIEWIIVLSGEIDYLFPDGTKRHLREKDSVVQMGCKHRWANNSDQDCVMAVAAIGAARPDVKATASS